jgi:hypothetical protein
MTHNTEKKPTPPKKKTPNVEYLTDEMLYGMFIFQDSYNGKSFKPSGVSSPKLPKFKRK